MNREHKFSNSIITKLKSVSTIPFLRDKRIVSLEPIIFGRVIRGKTNVYIVRARHDCHWLSLSANNALRVSVNNLKPGFHSLFSNSSN